MTRTAERIEGVESRAWATREDASSGVSSGAPAARASLDSARLSNRRVPCAYCGRLCYVNYTGALRKHPCWPRPSNARTIRFQHGGTLTVVFDFHLFALQPGAEREVYGAIVDALNDYENRHP